MPDETVRTKLEIDGAQALQVLKKIDEQATTVQGKQKQVAALINDYARSIEKTYDVAERKLSNILKRTEGGKLSDRSKEVLGGAREINKQAIDQNRYLTLDPKADASIRNYDGSLKKVGQSLVETRARAETLRAEMDKLFKPQQQRNIFGQFTNRLLPDFKTQLNSIGTYNGKLQLVEKTIESLAKKSGASFKDVGRELEKAFPDIKNTELVSTAIDNLNKKTMGLAGTFKSLKQSATQVDIELAKLSKSGRLDLTGTHFQNRTSLVNALKEIKATIPGVSFEQIAAGMRKMGVDGAYVRKALGEVNKELQGFRHGIDIVRTALGTLVAVGIFQFLSLITDAFSTATQNAKQLEESLYRLGNVERILSGEGIEVSMKGLEDGIQKIKELFPIFSREDIAGLVGQVAISTKELGLTEQQIIDLSQAIVVLNMRSIENESIHQTGQKVMSSLLTSNAKGVAALGLSFSQNAMEAKGMELGILEAGDALSDLSDQEKGQIKLAIALENTGQEVDSINDFLETNAAKIAENKASWNDFMTFIGQQINNLIPDISKFVEQLQKASELNAISGLFLDATNNKQEGIGQRLQDTSIWFKLGTGIKFTADEYERLKAILSTYSDEELLKIFPNPAAIKDRFVREIVEGLIEIKDTATDTTKALEDLTKFEGAEEFAQKLQDITDDFADAVDDLNTKRDQKLADLDLEYLRKAEDAQKDYARKVEDINRDAERDIARIKENHREQDRRDEERYQLQLWELRMRFLMDLEDALHARDARQVIRLQKQYALDKEALRRKHELEEREREESQSNELEDIERRRQERLADARIEYEQKLADQRVAKERELADLNVWYEREYADLKLNMERKIQALIDAGIREKEITEHNAAEVYKILQKYFGPGGLTDQLYQYMLQQFSQPIPISAPLPPGMPAPYWDLAAQSAQGVPTSTYGFAKGGTLIATRPTRALFGEAGPELVQFTPLNKIGSMNNSAGGSLDTLGMNGSIAVDLFLSPDLEARVVENSMNGVAEAIVKINRTKV